MTTPLTGPSIELSDEVLASLEEEAYTQACELDSPNSLEFWDFVDKLVEDMVEGEMTKLEKALH